GWRNAMAKVGFIGLGNMGLPMAANLIKAGHAVSGFDVNEDAGARLAAGGGTKSHSIAEACKDAEVVITMLPAGEHVREVYLGGGGALAAGAPPTPLVGFSTHHGGAAPRGGPAGAEEGGGLRDC